MKNPTGNSSSRAGSTNKVATVVYSEPENSPAYNSLFDSTGKHGMRQIQAAGCEDNEYSLESRLAVEIQNPYNWIMINY